MHFEESDNSSINREYVDALDLMGLLSCSTENFDEVNIQYYQRFLYFLITLMHNLL